MSEEATKLPGEWEEYQPRRARDKEFYDIRLDNGDIVECCYPNGIGWYPMHPNKTSKYGRISDDNVLQIRLCMHPMDYPD
jgi:hypothetical protein